MRFSVIIPLYNKEKTIRNSINSVLNQSYKDFELIIINDGSTDNSIHILKEYTQFNIRIINQKNMGVSKARNEGIINSKGDFICFLDADDIYKENHLEILNMLINKYSSPNFLCTSHDIEYNNHVFNTSKSLKFIKKDDMIIDNVFYYINKYGGKIIHTNSICVKREFLLKNHLFFNSESNIGEDTDMWFRLSLLTPLVLSKINTTIYRKKYSDLTKTTSNTLNWCFVKRNIDEYSNDRKVKKDCNKLKDNYYMTCYRDCIVLLDKNNANLNLKQVKYKSLKYLFFKILSFMPLTFQNHIIRRLSK